MDVYSGFDLIIVGAGAAGLRAAIAAAEANPEMKIALISKVYPTRSHTVAAEGGIAASIGSDDSPEIHAYDTIKGSDYLADQDAVEFFANHCCEEIRTLDKWGCPWSRDDKGCVAIRLFGGMNRKRAVYATDKTGFYILHTLYERSLIFENIKRYDEWFVTELLADEKGVRGIIAIDMKRGDMAAFPAKSVIMATGGPGRMYGHTTNSAINTGDGIALALNAGAALKDMEFVQFHPTSMPGTGILITEAARGEGAYLKNRHNKRFLIDYLPDTMEMGPRDLVTRAIISEYKAGRGFEGPHGLYMELDLTHLGEKHINEKLPQVRELSLTYLSIDPAKQAIPVTPAQHYFMGGIHTNKDTETTIPGLYACGENACTSINGANRLGSNSLAKCLIFGRVAGENASKYAHSKKTAPKIDPKDISASEQKIIDITNCGGKENLYEILDEMKQNMDAHAGILREEKPLTKGLDINKKLKERSQKISISQKNNICNFELIKTLELRNMLDLCETVFISALERKESRGAHFRDDYPQRDDEKYLLHHLVSRTAAGNENLKIDKLPVVITKWKPEVRTY